MTSYGYVSRNVITSLAKLGHSPAAHNIYGNTVSYLDEELEVIAATERAQHWDNTAPCVKIFHANQLDTFTTTSGKKIAYTIFELNRFRDIELRHIERLDGLIVCSEWAKKVCVSAGVTVPITVAPLGVNRDIFNDQLIPKDNDISRDDALKVFVSGKWEIRKCSDIILTAFERAFCSTDNVSLIMNCRNHFIGDKRNDDWALYYKTSKLANKIFVLDKYLSTQANVANLMASCDVALLPSRAEGWNLNALEAMSMGIPLITTNCTAHTEFCNSENSFLIDCPDLEPAIDGTFFDGFGEWLKMGESQIEQMSGYLRQLYKDKMSGNLKRNLAGIETAKQFSWERTAKAVLEACV